MEDCYVALGGNFKNTLEGMRDSIHLLSETEGVSLVASSRLYLTSPVSALPQPPYLNAVIHVKTILSPWQLFTTLENIEALLGKRPKAKEAPRLIDLDLLFYGSMKSDDPKLTIPHPRWQKRLFVLRPLLDLTKKVMEYDLQSMLTHFINRENEEVLELVDALPFQIKRTV